MPQRPVVETVTLVASTGRKIRKATRVILESGCVVTFIERVPKKQAIEQARHVCAKRSAQLGGKRWSATKQ